MPFPAGTNDHCFEFEGTLDRTRMLEGQLTQSTHSVNLLKIEIQKEGQLLKQDNAELELLERAWKEEKAQRKRQNKTLHSLARTLHGPGGGPPTTTNDVQIVPWVPVSSLRNLENDQSLKPLLKQLRSHLESMQNNTLGMKDISRAMEDAQAALAVWCTNSSGAGR